MNKPNETLREFYAKTAKTSDRAVIEFRDGWRKSLVSQLAKQSVIVIDEVKDLDRGGRFEVASIHFAKCAPDCQAYLLNDEHHFVRSAAALALPKGKKEVV